MKRISASILLTLYIAFSSGVVINLHYCMDRYDSFQLGAAKSEVCGKCGMHKTDANKCCNDEVKIFKIDDEQLLSGMNYKFPVAESDIVHHAVENTGYSPHNNYSLLYNIHSPPLNEQDTYLHNCVFRI